MKDHYYLQDQSTGQYFYRGKPQKSVPKESYANFSAATDAFQRLIKSNKGEWDLGPVRIISTGDISKKNPIRGFPKKFGQPKFERAYDLFKKAIQWENKYDSQVRSALSKYGDHGPLISGVIRDHFPKEVKDNLRRLVREKNRLTDLGFAAKPSRVHDKTMTELYHAVANLIRTKRRKVTVKKNPRQKDHWRVYAYQHINDQKFSMGYFDGTRAQAIKYFNAKENVKRYFRPGYTVTMEPNAIVLWDGYEVNPKVRQKKATTVSKDNGMTVRLYQTDIVKVLPNGDIQLNSGGHKTATTKRRMNEVADEFELYFKVFAKGGQWFISTEDRLEPPQTFEFYDGIVFSGPQHLRKNPKRKKAMRKKKRSAKQLANDRRLGRMAKARAKAKRGGRSRVTRKVTRKKTTRRNPHKKRTALKKSHLWFVFRCKGNQVHYLTSANKWTVLSTNSILFRTVNQAQRGLNAAYTGKHFDYGIANADQTSAQIRAKCKAGKV